MKKFVFLFLGLSAVILVTFALAGDLMDTLFHPEQTQALLEEQRWLAGPMGAVLLISDLFLPIPTTIIIGALGAVLGVPAGTFWGWIGLNLSAWLGYWLGRWKGGDWGSISAADQKRFGKWFNHSGGWAVVLSRWIPILPEVISLLAGMYRMSPRHFAWAVALGSLPPAWMYAWIGSTTQEAPFRAVSLFIGVTLLGWLLYQRCVYRAEALEKD